MNKPLLLRLLVPVLWAAALHLSPRPAAFDAALQAAWEARVAGSAEQEGEALRLAASFQPWRADYWLRIGRLASRVEDWQGAVRAYRQAQDRGALPPPDRLAFGEAHWQLGETQEAIEAWQPLMRGGEAGQELFRRVYEFQRSGGDFDGAVQTLDLWKSAEPENARVAYRLGLLALLESPEDGLELLDEAAELDAALLPDAYAVEQALQANTGRDLALGQALGRLEEWDLAAEFYRRAVGQHPDDAGAWAFLGEALDMSGQDGEEAIERALRLDPGSVTARAEAALHWRREGQYETALSYLESLAKEQPGKAVWQVEIGSTWAAAGKYDEAYAGYRRALELDPENDYHWSVLAQFCLENLYDLRGTGLPAARQALMLSPDTPEYLDLMGAIFMQLEDFTSAERFLQQALAVDAKLASAHLHLGQMYLYQGQEALAYQHLDQAMAHAGDHARIGLLAGRLLEEYFSGAPSASQMP